MPKVKNHPADTHAITYEEGGEEHWLDTHHGEERAAHFCRAVNLHESENGRPMKYYVTRID